LISRHQLPKQTSETQPRYNLVDGSHHRDTAPHVDARRTRPENDSAMSVPATSVRRSPRNHQHQSTFPPTIAQRLSSGNITVASSLHSSNSTNVPGSPTSNTSSSRSIYSPPAMTQHTHYFPPQNANVPAMGGQAETNGVAIGNGTIGQSPGFKATKLARRSSKKGVTPGDGG
jgi:hypothetical protein